MFSSLELINWTFDAIAFALSSWVYFNWISDQEFGWMDAIRVGFEFFVTLIIASVIYKSVSGLPDFAISAKKDVGVDLLAISLFILYYGFRAGFSSAVIVPLLVIGIGAGILGSFLKRLLSSADFLPVSMQVDLKKMSMLPPDIPAGPISGGSLGL